MSDDIRSGIGAESVVRQANRAQQLRALGDATNLRGLLIEGIAGSDKGNHAAGTHLVNGLGEKDSCE